MNEHEDSLRRGLRLLARGHAAEAKACIAQAMSEGREAEAREALALVEEILSFRHSDLYNP